MKQAVIIIGVGELGGVFARGFLRLGYPVYPVTREINILDAVNNYPDPKLVLVAVAEKDLSNILKTIPVQWRNRLVLLQNELLPRQWKIHNIDDPTVVIVWFEKKKGQGCKVLLPSRIYGPNDRLIVDALESLEIPGKMLASEEELLSELVIKNIFVLTINIAGIKTGGTVRTLWLQHNEFVRQIADEVIEIQEWLTGATFPRDILINGLAEAINSDPEHKCKGRSAPERLARVLKIGDEAGLRLPKIREIQMG
jgi:hypothetical protein